MIKKITELSPVLRGLLMITIGAILLLYILGILEKSFGVIIVFGSFYLIFQGMIVSGIYEKIQKLIKHT